MRSPCPHANIYPAHPDEKLVFADELEEEGEAWELIAWLRLRACNVVGTQDTPYGKVYVGIAIVGFDFIPGNFREWNDYLTPLSQWNGIDWINPDLNARLAIEGLVEKAMRHR